jgi:RND family efflux transporter MFP subunit
MVLIFSACPHTAEAPKPQVMTVGTQRVETLNGAQLSSSAPEYIAAVRANEETDFSFKVGGILELIGPEAHRDWEEGSAVKAGAVLARLQQAGNVVSKQEVDKSKADTETAEAQLRQAEQNLRDSELRAPWNGVVLSRYVNSGETVNSGKLLLRFGDIRTMSVELGVPDRLVGLFAVDKEIDVDISALSGRPPFRGKISEVGVAANNAGRLYRVVIKVPNPEGIIKSGMTATVKAGGVTVPAGSQVLAPLSALVAPSSPALEAGQPRTQLAVFVVKNGRAALRLVKTGDVVVSSIIVTDGLQAGEEVVTKGASQLYDGAPVTVR